MTPKQTERLKKKIVDIKRTLAAEKRKFGCYDDSRGLRYIPTRYFIQLGDYSGGLTYIKWFDKNFPDDSGFPEFLFEQTIIFFKTGNTKEAVQKAFETFYSNTYWFDKFFGKPLTPINMWHGSNIAEADYSNALAYSSSHPELLDFSEWLSKLISTNDFLFRSDQYIDVCKRLKTETDKELRQLLVLKAYQLKQAL